MSVELNLRFSDDGHGVVVRRHDLRDDDGSGALSFENPLGDKDLRDIQWYVETYGAHSLGDPDDKEAQRIFGQLPSWGKKLFQAVFHHREEGDRNDVIRKGGTWQCLSPRTSMLAPCSRRQSRAGLRPSLGLLSHLGFRSVWEPGVVARGRSFLGAKGPSTCSIDRFSPIKSFSHSASPRTCSSRCAMQRFAMFTFATRLCALHRALASTARKGQLASLGLTRLALSPSRAVKRWKPLPPSKSLRRVGPRSRPTRTTSPSSRIGSWHC